MYLDHYKLTCQPFATAPDANFMYWSASHSLAVSMLRYGLMTAAPITVVTGGVGLGKTTLLRCLLREIPNDLEVGLISALPHGHGKLLHWILQALNVPFGDESHVALYRLFEAHVIDRYSQGKRVVLIFDEAQTLDIARLEELRMLSNINSDGDTLLQLVLVGQPQLRQTLLQGEVTQFVQRISADFNLMPLERSDVANYIDHRMKIAGARWRIFSPDAYDQIFAATGGVPRLINTLCDLSLVYGLAAEQRVVDAALVREFLDSTRHHGIYNQFLPSTEPDVRAPGLLATGRS